MPKFLNIIYFVLSAFILFFGVTALLDDSGKIWTKICILLIGLYFLYRGIALTVNNAHAREREKLRSEDQKNDPANA